MSTSGSGPAPGSPGAVVRAARLAAGWDQATLGRRCGYSASQISRWETGRAQLRDVEVLRVIAHELGLDPATLGVIGRDTPTTGRAAGPTTGGMRRSRPTVGDARSPSQEVDDDVRRRSFLAAAGLAGASLLAGPPGHADADLDPARLLERRLGDVLLASPTLPPPGSPADLPRALDAARAQFAACKYVPLSSVLPALLVAAEAAARTDPADQAVLARSYHLTCQVLGKLEAGGLQWIAADRSMQAAVAADDPLMLAESHRVVATVARRGGDYSRAQQLALSAADTLAAADTSPAATAMLARLRCAAGYAAAQAGDRARAYDLLTDARQLCGVLPDRTPLHPRTIADVVSHHVSAAYALGDAGAALAAAQQMPLAAVPTLERRARLLVDVAQAWAQWGRPAQALRSLLIAERTAPGEVRTRSAVRRLVTQLTHSPANLPGLQHLARRVHAQV